MKNVRMSRIDADLLTSERPKKFVESDGKRSFLRVPVARSGIFLYRAKDLTGTDTASRGFQPNDVVKVYRPENVFTAALLEKGHIVPVTNDHPDSSQVTLHNSHSEVCGAASNPTVKIENGVSTLYYDIKLWDAGVLDAYENGKVELSIGCEPTEGTWADKKDPYDRVEGILRIDHFAVVNVARAGHKFRLHNKSVEHDTMPETTVDNSDTLTETLKVLTTMVSEASSRTDERLDNLNDSLTKVKKVIENEAKRTDALSKQFDKLEKTDGKDGDKTDGKEKDGDKKSMKGEKADGKKEARTDDVFYRVDPHAMAYLLKGITQERIAGFIDIAKKSKTFTSTEVVRVTDLASSIGKELNAKGAKEMPARLDKASSTDNVHNLFDAPIF